MSARVIVVQESASLLGPILIAAGALLAAILTVLTANWRHRKQLEHDRDVQQTQLEHDQNVQLEQLRQDRELRYREHVQQVLDTAIDRATHAVQTISAYARATEAVEAVWGLQKGERAKKDDPEDSDLERVKLETRQMEASRDSFRSLNEAHSADLRLRLRFGVERDVTKALDALLSALNSRADALVETERRMRTEEEKAADQSLKREIQVNHAVFHRACAKWHAELIASPPSASGQA